MVDAVTPDRAHNELSQAPRLPPGIEAKQNDDVQDVRESLITIVNHTLTQGRLDGAISYLANQDRDRIKDQLEQANPDYENSLDPQISSFQTIFFRFLVFPQPRRGLSSLLGPFSFILKHVSKLFGNIE